MTPPFVNKGFVVSIGNTDNKLSQQEWAQFVEEMQSILDRRVEKFHFFAGSESWKPWQNVAWIAEVRDNQILLLVDEIVDCRTRYSQDSAMIMHAQAYLV